MQLNISTGEKEYGVNGCILKFNPTDTNFIERVFDVVEALDEENDKYHNKMASGIAGKEAFALMRDYDDVIRFKINELFGHDVCSAIFGSINMNAGDGDGLQLWAAFLFTLIDEFDASFASEKAAHNPRIAKYTSKYKARMH